MSERKSIWRKVGKLAFMLAVVIGLAGSTGCFYGGHGGGGGWHHHDHYDHYRGW